MDKYVDLGEPAEYKQFDPNLKQALAWQRFIDGVPTPEDLEWLHHEFTEQKYELEHKAGYKESHEYAERFFKGDPWIDEWDTIRG